MTPEQLAEAHATTIRKHYRRLEDHPGQVHTELLDDLAAIAEQHATETVGQVVADPPAGVRARGEGRPVKADRSPIA